ncbi:PREDICTED: telomerase reverse transcriptase isoform X2 [Nelumbo nucifera]|uniref:Telomerase reverse transcriptase n=2 Tax=Nelumbo nucifera TaxID=4432 RepID=A0A1U7ZY57_NELNU|nr:PREDICTED: telomerase reverse transcriptase isoform X2 [Nelumbo nucifera]DAD42342.1 TPA_asm: hypothetical protein HUJ06_000572 [Nelumbo nucifera]
MPVCALLRADPISLVLGQTETVTIGFSKKLPWRVKLALRPRVPAQMRKRRRVPEVLWRLYRNQVRSLADTIISLLPPPSSSADCRCKGRRCLGCSGKDAMSFLLRPEDPPDYHRLLNECFIVVSDNAPNLTSFYTDHRWTQDQIVKKTIEMILSDSQSSSNVICNGYDKGTRSSSIVDLLTTSAWCVLLQRIQDHVMIHLLKYTSIFLPLPLGNHHQVAGPSIIDLGIQFSRNISESDCPQSSPVQFGPQKRKRVDHEDNSKPYNVISLQQSDSIFGVNNSLGSFNCHIGCNRKSSLSSFDWNHINSSEAHNLDFNVNNKVDSNGKLQESLSKTTKTIRKHLRPFSWQRHRKRIRMNCPEESVLQTSTSISNDKENTSGMCQQNSSGSLRHQRKKATPCQELKKLQRLQVHSKKMASLCLYHLMLQAPPNVTKATEINRQLMFYKSGYSSCLLPRNHILNMLKPNNTGAILLMRDIFGLCDGNPSTQSIPCFQTSSFCLNEAEFWYHPLLGFLKSLIHRAQHCKHLKLLDKHCMVPALGGDANRGVKPFFEGNRSQAEITEKRNSNIFLSKCNSHVTRQQDKHSIKTPNTKLNDCFCAKDQVVSFIWAVCRRIVPPDLLGDPSNWRALRRNIYNFIRLRRFEKFCLKQCMHGLKISCFPFLLNKNFFCCLSCHFLKDGVGKGAGILDGNEELSTLKDKIFASWVYWFFSRLLIPIIHANFYVTESEFGKQDIFYYRKPIWEKLTNRAISLLKEQNYQLLEDSSFRNIIRKRRFGFSKVRFCPKEIGMRVLANLRAPSRVYLHKSYLKDNSCGVQKNTGSYSKAVKCDHFKSVNYVLYDLHTVLKGLKVKNPEKLGSSVFDYNDIYKKLCQFLISLKNESGSMPNLFIVVCDVFKAFDSVDQDKLLSVMKDVFLDDEYLVKQFSKVVCTKKTLSIQYDQILSDTTSNGGIKTTTSSIPSDSSHFVLVNQEKSRKIRKEELFHNLYEHVKHNVLQFGQKFYLQEVGIPQGSVLSSLLCSFYYGHLERNVIFPFLEKNHDYYIVIPSSSKIPIKHNSQNTDATQSDDKDEVVLSTHKYMLMRLIDDFLFISTSKKQAVSFFSRLQRGFREYNCFMNEEKFCVNFDIDHVSKLSSNRVYIGEDGVPFLPWSGLLINCSTLEIQADYTRYANIHLRSTLTVFWQGKSGHYLKAKLCDYMRPKCHPIFYDSNINSAAVVRLNVYQSFLLCAMKFHCYVCELSKACILPAAFHSKIIQNSFRFMYNLIKKRVHSVHLGLSFHPILQLNREEVEWLGLTAYIRVLRRKQSRHIELLSLLRSKLVTCEITGSASSELKYAVDDLHSSLFWNLKY